MGGSKIWKPERKEKKRKKRQTLLKQIKTWKFTLLHGTLPCTMGDDTNHVLKEGIYPQVFLAFTLLPPEQPSRSSGAPSALPQPPPTAAPWAGQWSQRREKQLNSFSEKQDSVLTISSPPVTLQKCKPLMENMFSIKWLEKLSKKFVIISELSNLTTDSYQVWLAQSYTRLIKIYTYLFFLGFSSKWFKLSITNKDSEN